MPKQAGKKGEDPEETPAGRFERRQNIEPNELVRNTEQE
jgi:hypothetical protein